MPEVRVLAVPYELGRLRDGVGRGPEALLEHGAAAALAAAGATVTTELIELDARFNATGSGDVDAAFELIRMVADGVRRARRDGAFPVVLAGSCFAAVGVVAGLDEADPGVVWLDAHSDFNEPVTTLSGYFDGMGLAVLTGGAWQGLLATVPGARPVPERRVVLAGARDLEPPEEVRLADCELIQLPTSELRSAAPLVSAVAALEPAVSGLYVHLDLDVLDAAVAGVNVYSAPGGIDGGELDDLVAALAARFPVRAVTLSAYDPGYDPDGRVPPIALRVLATVAAASRT